MAYHLTHAGVLEDGLGSGRRLAGRALGPDKVL